MYDVLLYFFGSFNCVHIIVSARQTFAAHMRMLLRFFVFAQGIPNHYKRASDVKGNTLYLPNGRLKVRPSLVDLIDADSPSRRASV